MDLADTGRVSGAQTATLTLSNVSEADDGAYYAVATNSFGSTTSALAALLVIPAPTILPVDPGFGSPSNSFGLSVLSVSGQIVVVEVSSNLVNWAPWSTGIAGANPLEFTDPLPVSTPRRFYRARVSY